MGDTKIYAKRIKELRMGLDLTQTNFAKKINCAQTALSSYENGNTIPSLDTMINISRSFNVSIDWLCGLSPKKSYKDKISTYPDIIQALIEISDAIECEIQTMNSEYTCVNGDTGYPEFHTSDYPVLFIKDQTMMAFLNEWDKIKTLYNQNTIDKEVYLLWVEKTMKKYSEYTQPNDLPF